MPMDVTFASFRGHTFYRLGLGIRPRILDLGANHGGFAREASERLGAEVRMVEANPKLCAELSTPGSLPVFHCAVTDKTGWIAFNLALNDEGSSILTLPPKSKFDCVLTETITVPTRTIASLLEEIGWDHVDLIKMDIEGAEVCVLNALEPALLDRIGQLSIEFHGDSVFGLSTHEQVEKCLKKMRRLGFLVLDFTLPGRFDVLMLNTRVLRISLTNRLGWQLTRRLYQVIRMTPPAFRKNLKILLKREITSS
jgi:FkbM family methyltransferase